MSGQDMTEMMERAGSDAAFAQGLVEAVGGRSGEEAIDAIVAYGNSRGFAVSVEDVQAMRRRMLAAGGDAELDDSDLDGVAGGIGGGQPDDAFGSLFGGLLSPTPGSDDDRLRSPGFGGGGDALNAFVKQW